MLQDLDPKNAKRQLLDCECALQHIENLMKNAFRDKTQLIGQQGVFDPVAFREIMFKANPTNDDLRSQQIIAQHLQKLIDQFDPANGGLKNDSTANVEKKLSTYKEQFTALDNMLQALNQGRVPPQGIVLGAPAAPFTPLQTLLQTSATRLRRDPAFQRVSQAAIAATQSSSLPRKP